MMKFEMPPDFPQGLVLDAMKLIMSYNVFEAGDTFHSKSLAQQWAHRVHAPTLPHTMPTVRLRSSCGKAQTQTAPPFLQEMH